jgi:hypothetical protein
MTSVFATSSSSYHFPLQKLQDELQAEVNSGAISSPDQAPQNSLSATSASSYSATGACDSGGNTSASFSMLLINDQT